MSHNFWLIEKIRRDLLSLLNNYFGGQDVALIPDKVVNDYFYTLPNSKNFSWGKIVDLNQGMVVFDVVYINHHF